MKLRYWTKPGHPGACPKCSRWSVRWTWRPDQNPTRETARCMSCGWVEHRDSIDFVR